MPAHAPPRADTGTQTHARPQPASRLQLALLAGLPVIAYLASTWAGSANTPQGDGYIQSIFTVLFFLDGNTLADSISNTWWTYFQHRAIASKLLTLSLYAGSGELELQWLGIVGNLCLGIMVWLIALNIRLHGLPAWLAAVTGLLTLNLYSWSVSTWPECTFFYYLTLVLVFGCFYSLDREKPCITAAIACSWLATFNMANGVLSLVAGSLIVGWNQYHTQRYSRRQILAWAAACIACLALYLSTINVFSTDLYGAKSVQESFTGIPARLVDFLESMGAAPFAPGEYRPWKIVLGCFTLVWLAIALLQRTSYRSPAVVALLLFSTGTIFITSLFRYSAGSNDGYQIFTCINFACLFILSMGHVAPARATKLLPLLLLAALAFNLNALARNLPAAIQKHEKMASALEHFLTAGNTDAMQWHNMFLQAAISQDIYRPLQSHRLLPVAARVAEMADCPATSGQLASTLDTQTAPTAFAIRLALGSREAAFAAATPSLLLCSDGNHYRIKPGRQALPANPANGGRLTLLLDKRRFAPGQYRVLLAMDGNVFDTSQALTIDSIAPYEKHREDCQSVHWAAPQKAFAPLREYFCHLKDRQP